MTGLDALQSVQFVSQKGQRFAVVSAEDWESLVDWLETLEDSKFVKESFAELQAAKGNRRKAGWLKWSEARKELE